jgi:HK97 family phage major capsid protein
MASKIKELQDRATAVADQLDELHALESRTDDQNEQIERLNAEAERLAPELEQEKAISDRIAKLRAAARDAGHPVEVADEPKPAKKPAPRYSRLRGFTNVDDAEVCGHWIRGFLLGRDDSRQWYHDHVENRALSSTDNSKGGVFIPETFASTVIRLVDEFSAIPSQANVIPMASDTLYVPRRTGGNTAYFVADNSETTASDMATDNVMLSAKDCRVASRVPNSLIEDSVVDLAGLVAQEFALALSQKIDDSGFAGDGTSTYGGIRGIQWKFENETLTAGTNDSGESALSSVTIDDFAETIGKLPSYARPGAGWYVTPQVYSTCMLPLMLSAGGASAAELAAGASEQRFMGYPVYFNNSMRTSVSNGQVICLFGNMRLSTHYGLRRDITVRASTDRYIEFDQTYFQATCRFDVVTSDVGDASTAGPVVALTL